MSTVIIDKIGDTDAKNGAIKARVETSNTFPLDDTTNSIIGRRLCALGFNLCTGRKRDERVSAIFSIGTPVKQETGRFTHVNVMERRPPPAPARAWAKVSLCCAGDVVGAMAALLSVG